MKRSLAAALGIIIAWSGVARPEYLQLSNTTFTHSSSCFIADPGPGGTVTVYVLLRFTLGATSVSFSAPVSPYAGLQFVGDVLPAGFTAVGDSQTHVDVSFGTCMAGGDVVVMEMHFIRVGDADACVPYAIQPGASMHDCSFVEKSTADSQVGFALNTNGPCSSPYRHPFPADGAVNVPLKTVLNWASPGGVFACGTPVTAAPAVAAGTERVYFGTTPNPPYDESATYYNGVGPLLPETTYYWQINAQFPPPFASPVWSFTTMSTVPTTPTTWGSIKALYR